MRQQRADEHLLKDVRRPGRPRSRGRPARRSAGAMGNTLQVICSGTLKAKRKCSGACANSLLQNSCGGELVEGEIAADGGEDFAYSRRHSASKSFLGEASARQVALAAVDLSEPAFVLPGTAADVDILRGQAGAGGPPGGRAGTRRDRRRADLPRLRSPEVVRVGAGLDQAGGPEADHHRRRAAGVARADVHDVLAALQFGDYRRARCARRAAGCRGSWRDCRSSKPGARSGSAGLHGGLGIHAEEDRVEQHLQQRLILIVAAGRGEGDHGLDRER